MNRYQELMRKVLRCQLISSIVVYERINQLELGVSSLQPAGIGIESSIE